MLLAGEAAGDLPISFAIEERLRRPLDWWLVRRLLLVPVDVGSVKDAGRYARWLLLDLVCVLLPVRLLHLVVCEATAFNFISVHFFVIITCTKSIRKFDL